MYTLLIFLFVIAASLMTVTILMQSSKGGGLASSFGGLGAGGGVLGPRGAANFLQKATTILAVLYAVLTIIIGLMGRPTEGEQQSIIQREMQRQQQSAPSQLPVAPMQGNQQQQQAQPQGQQQQPQQEQKPQ